MHFGRAFISMFAMARTARFAGASFATTKGQLELCHPGRCPFTAWEVGSLEHMTLKYLKVALQEAHHNGNNWSYWMGDHEQFLVLVQTSVHRTFKTLLGFRNTVGKDRDHGRNPTWPHQNILDAETGPMYSYSRIH